MLIHALLSIIQLGFQDQVLPFSLMLFLTGSMSHADSAVVQVAFKNAVRRDFICRRLSHDGYKMVVLTV